MCRIALTDVPRLIHHLDIICLFIFLCSQLFCIFCKRKMQKLKKRNVIFVSMMVSYIYVSFIKNLDLLIDFEMSNGVAIKKLL